jgi:hypothetical protein
MSLYSIWRHVKNAVRLPSWLTFSTSVHDAANFRTDLIFHARQEREVIPLHHTNLPFQLHQPSTITITRVTTTYIKPNSIYNTPSEGLHSDFLRLRSVHRQKNLPLILTQASS